MRRLFDMGAGLRLVKRLLLPQNWHVHLSLLKAPPLKAATLEAVLVRGIISSQILIGDLLARAWFNIDESLTEDGLLGTSFIDKYNPGIFPAEWKVVPIHSRPVEILMSLSKVMLLLKEDV